MPEQKTDTLLQNLIDRTIGTREAIHVNEVIAADIPKGIKVYVRSEVIRWLRGEFAAAPKFARVDTSAPGTRQLTNAFLGSLCNAYFFPRAEFLNSLENAVRFLENYLCRPQWTLENFIFEECAQVSVEQLLQKLDFTSDYAYFRRLIEKYVQQRGYTQLAREDFRFLLARIDEQIVKQHSARELAMLTKPIFDFLTLEGAEGDPAIPLKPLLVFFEDKKMKILKEYIEGICRIRNQGTLTLGDLTTLIEDLYLSRTEEAEVHPRAFPPTSPPEVSLQEGSEEMVASSAVSSLSPASDTHEEGPPVLPEDSGMSSEATADRSLQQTPRTFPESEIPGGARYEMLPDLHGLIPEKDKARFVRKIFKKDRDYFNVIIASLNKITTWKEASLFLNRVFELNHLDPFADEVIAFTDAVQQRFRDEERKHG